jgi:hypothetical protein
MFLERKTKASTLEGFKLALRRQTISPALEKIHKKQFFIIRVEQWIRVPRYQNGYPGTRSEHYSRFSPVIHFLSIINTSREIIDHGVYTTSCKLKKFFLQSNMLILEYI